MRSRFNINNYSNLAQRVIAAIIGGSILIAGTIYDQWLYFAIFFVICMLAQLEFYKLVGLDGMLPLKTVGTILGCVIFTMSYLVELKHLPDSYYFLIFPLVSIIFFIKLYKKSDKKPFTSIAFTFLGIFYVGIPFALLNVAAFSVNGIFQYEIILGTLFILWASDSGAYFAGTRFGKTKLFERISPKKSWEGSVGGAITSFGVALVLASKFTILDVTQWMIITTIIIIAGTYGDLVESLFKRSIEIKDSGQSIPGHGGFLDRFDGLLLASPFITAFLKIF
ncbi:phosphatidate cytidylyltransferase [Penaeicola halotolerans]|uniref:phosphatidate cytidylyltransferase n=1 Tax=Penaeicola halotolerans TaxID=2793196 RepID=UPI001CF8988B|nr:phosphatidate cytidylyltransferase [Penaeicola halotolerans]